MTPKSYAIARRLELQRRSAKGYTQFVPPGWNEALLAAAGLQLLETEDRTMSVGTNASGRLAATQAHRAELEAVWSAAEIRAQQEYLETVVALARRRAVSRVMYLTEVQTPAAV